MKKTTIAAAVIALAGANLAGCKSTPKTSWWKTAKAPESTAVAHTAPPLPSDLAKPGTSATASTPTASGGQAPPFVASSAAPSSTATASSSPAGYPSTDAPPFTAAVASQIGGTTPSSAGTGATSTTTNSTSLGNIAAMPYNASAVPPAKTGSGGLEANPAIPESRYPNAMASTASPYGQPGASGTTTAGGASGGAAPGGPAYGAGSASQVAGTGTTTSPSGDSAIDNAGSNAAGRYNSLASSASQAVTGAVDGATGAAVDAAGSVQTTAAQMATGQTYRPGGTGTYPSTPVEVATRPQTGTTSTQVGGATSVGSPAYDPQTPTRYR